MKPGNLLIHLFCMSTLLVNATGTTLAAESAGTARPRIGLVLGGGGARGAAHVGVLKVLESLRIPIDCIAGTSMGAIIGGLYASGMSPAAMETALATIDWVDIFRDDPPRAERTFVGKRDDYDYLVKGKIGIQDHQLVLPKGAIQGQKLENLLQNLTQPVMPIHNFDHLPVPFRAVATDIGTGAPIVLNHGNLSRALRASMSIPTALAPVEIDGRMLVDGGVANNLPVDVARGLCADRVIVVNVGTPLMKTAELTSMLAITSQLTTIMTDQNTQHQLATLTAKDLLITPELDGLGTLDFERSPEAAAIGERAAHQQREALATWGIAAPDYARYRMTHRWKQPPATVGKAQEETQPKIIDAIRIEQNTPLADQVLLEQMRTQAGQPLDFGLLEQDISRIHGLNYFQRVSYQLEEEQGRNTLVIDASARDWGPNYLQIGLNLEANFKGDSLFNLGGRYLRTGVNDLGGQLRVSAQIGQDNSLLSSFYQPMDYAGQWFVEPTAGISAFNVNSFHDGVRSEYRVNRWLAGVDGGRNFQPWGEARLGLRYGQGDISNRKGTPAPDYSGSNADFTESYYFLRLRGDTLDNMDFPSSGNWWKLEYVDAMTALGADDNHRTLSMNFIQPFHWEAHRLIAGLELGGRLSGNLTTVDRFTLGGFTRLSGYQERELSGEYLALAKLIYMYRLDNASTAFTVPMYVGGSLETGNIWQDRDEARDHHLQWAGSLFVGIDSPLGPVYLAGGLAQGNQHSLYFYLGRTF